MLFKGSIGLHDKVFLGQTVYRSAGDCQCSGAATSRYYFEDVGPGYGDHDSGYVVIAIRTSAQNVEAEVYFGIREKYHGAKVVKCHESPREKSKKVKLHDIFSVNNSKKR